MVLAVGGGGQRGAVNWTLLLRSVAGRLRLRLRLRTWLDRRVDYWKVAATLCCRRQTRQAARARGGGG